MEKQAPGNSSPEMQTRMFTLRLTPTQHARFVELASQARIDSGLSCNTWVLVQLGLLTKDEAIELSRKLGLRGRKLANPSTSNSGVQPCDSAL